MALSAIGGMIYANQNMHLAATKQTDHQGTDFQNITAASLANDKIKDIQETRALEEDKTLSPDRKHYHENTDKRAVKKRDENKSQNDELPHLLDIRA